MTPTPTSGPLGRDSMKFAEKMQKYHAAMENALYAAEIECPDNEVHLCHECRFASGTNMKNVCPLDILRDALGDHVPQHDIPQVEETR